MKIIKDSHVLLPAKTTEYYDENKYEKYSTGCRADQNSQVRSLAILTWQRVV